MHLRRPRLSSSACALIATPSAEILFSVVSAWEIAIKSRTGRLGLPADVPAFVHDQVRRNRFTVLPIGLRHALQVQALPDYIGTLSTDCWWPMRKSRRSRCSARIRRSRPTM